MKTKIFFISLVCNLLICNAQLFAGWELMQNSPTTNDLHSVYFLDDNTGWIAGYNSTIYKTTNSGVSWQQQTSPESCNFECIFFVEANTGWACGSGGVVIKTTNGGASWFSQTFTASRFNSMDFYNANTGYICGDNGNIRKTTNGGTTWNVQVSGVSQNLHEIKFINLDTGFAVGENAYILKTSSGGGSWAIKSGPGIASQVFYTISLNNIYQLATGTLTKYSVNNLGENWDLGEFPADVVYSLANTHSSKFLGVGANGYIVKTTNYGVNWIQEQSPTSQNLYSVCYTGVNFVFAVGANGSILKYTPNWKYSLTGVNNKYSLEFINQNTGWVVGESGYIVKTTNSGTNWAFQISGTSYDLTSVYFTDANTGYAVGANGTIIRTTNGGINWTAQTSGTSNYLYSVYFTNASTGYTVGQYGTILRTTNSGTNWQPQNSGTANYLYSVHFADANTGYTVGGSGTVLKTTNGGANWITQTSGTSNSLYSVHFTDANTGYTSGTGSVILKTTNGGTTWLMQTLVISIFWYSIYFIDANVGYVCSNSRIYKTNDGGNTWLEDELPGGEVTNMREIQIVVENNTAVGFAVGDNILRTSFEYLGGEPVGNSGNYPGWVAVQSNTTGYISKADYINPFVAFGVGGDPGGSEMGLVLRTINGGQTWTRQQSNLVTSALSDVSFADVNNGIAVGQLGIIIHTTNSGANWVQQTSGTTFPLESVDMLDVNNAFVCGSFGRILYTSNGGTNWQTQVSGSNGLFFAIDYINPTTATVVGFQGEIRRTTNTGASWFQQSSGGTLNFTGVQFIDVNTGIAISIEGPVLRTANGGLNWIQTDSLSGYASDISYIDANNVFIVTQFAGVSRIYRSTNGGLSWILQTTDFATYSAVSFTDANNGVITGTDGLILRTSNAGVISGTNTSYSRNNLGLPINDFQNTNDSINVNITDNPVNIVTRVYLKIDTVLHTNDGDLEFYLEHNGITDTLVYRVGGSGDNFLGTFLNDATNFPLISGSAPFRGSYKPYRPLSKFNGQSPNGYWKLRIYDAASGNTGTLEAWSLIITYTNVIGITGNQNIPAEFKLYQNYPNPFNPVTKIKFSIPRGSGRDLSVKLRIYDILGREVTTLINQQMKPGSYLVEWNAGNYASGVYFYRLETEFYAETKKMVLVK